MRCQSQSQWSKLDDSFSEERDPRNAGHKDCLDKGWFVSVYDDHTWSQLPPRLVEHRFDLKAGGNLVEEGGKFERASSVHGP